MWPLFIQDLGYTDLNIGLNTGFISYINDDCFIFCYVENEDTNDGCDDETNDPEYDYLEDINEEENIDKEEIRCDRAVRVSSKSLCLLHLKEIHFLRDCFSLCFVCAL